MTLKLKAAPSSGEAARQRLFLERSSTSLVESTHTDELVIALCGPIGTPLHDVALGIGESLREVFGYQIENVRLSTFIEEFAQREGDPAPATPVQRRSMLIRRGHEMRVRFGPEVLAELAVKQIRMSRELAGRDPTSREFVPRRVCHIVHSIKSPQELELLRAVYREVVYTVGVFSPLAQRKLRLQREGFDEAGLSELMDPESGAEVAEGLAVDETFPLCDYFLRSDGDTRAKVRSRVERFLHLILGTRVITPTRMETAMHAAASAAGNSACLSRQVGAAVTDGEGEILAIGWNDVPRPFGGLYVSNLLEDPHGRMDERCWNNGGKCHNDEEKDALSAHVMKALTPFIPETHRAAATAAVFHDRKLRSLLEFSRAVHAEMHALLTALRHAGERVRGGKLFVTTYPCHVCARHIVAAGIEEIFFIEPYKKSLAIKLHGDALTEFEHDRDKVRLIPFDGVAPARYLSFFRMSEHSRKRNGRVIKIVPAVASPRLKKSLRALPALEDLVIESLQRRLPDMSTASHRPF